MKLPQCWRPIGLVGLLLPFAFGPLDNARAGKGKEAKDGHDADRAAIVKTSEAFVSAFQKGDAKAIAQMWTEEGEYNDSGDAKMKGRAAIEKGFAEFFAKNKGATIETKIDGIRFLSAATAVEDGAVTVHLPSKAVNRTRYSVLHVKEGGKWLMAILREWDDDEVVEAKLPDLDWLIGSWSGKTPDGAISMSYAWNKQKTFIEGTFSSKDISGKHIIGRDPVDDVLRSWTFAADGSFGQAVWFQDGPRWSVQSSSKLLDGSTLTSTNLVHKVSADAFSWQSVNRRLDGVAQPDTLPIQLTRVKSGK